MGECIFYSTAGGVVVNKYNEMLALERTVVRNGKTKYEVRLPKGRIDPGETAAQAAVREVGEESGYWDVEIVSDLGEEHSSFSLDGVQYERNERYFLMRLTREERGEPAPVGEEEALFTPLWLPADEASNRLTYSSEKVAAERACIFLIEQRHNN